MNDLLDFIQNIRNIFDKIHNYYFSYEIPPIDPVQAFFEYSFNMPYYNMVYGIHNSTIAKGTQKIYYVLDSIYKRGTKNANGHEKFFDMQSVNYDAHVFIRRDITNNNKIMLTTYRVDIQLNYLNIKIAPMDFYEQLLIYSYHLILINKLILRIKKAVIELEKIIIRLQVQNPTSIVVKNVYDFYSFEYKVNIDS